MSRGDKLTRGTGYLAIFAVSAVAAWISYWHAVAVVGQHGEPGSGGHLYPATIDGLIVAASMVVLDSARHREKPPRLAWWLIGAGVVATLVANVLDGITFGFLGSVIAAWPAAAFVGAYEMIMVLIRSGAARAEKPALATADWTPEELAKFERDLEELPREMPRLVQTLQTKPPWEGAAAPSPPAQAEALPSTADLLAEADHRLGPEYAGVTVRSPLSRLDKKVPVDERTGRTGTFPAVTE